MIPINILPKTLKMKIVLNNISKIELLHKKGPAFYVNAMIFMKQFAPSIRYYNLCKFEHRIGI
jgi:hypothetical protein